MKDVLIIDIGVQVYIIDGSRRTDNAARAVISALCENGRITPNTADRAKEDRKTLDDIKKRLIHCTMETRTTTTGDRWTFYTKSGVFMDIPSNSRNYIRADKYGNIYSVEAPRMDETTTEAESCTIEETSAQEGTESAKTTDMETFKKEYSRIYNHLYDHEGHAGVDATRRKYSRLFDELWEQIKDVVKAFCTITGDLLTSDRECAAFMLALESAGTPRTEETTTAGQDTTCTDTEPQRATEDARTATETAKRHDRQRTTTHRTRGSPQNVLFPP